MAFFQPPYKSLLDRVAGTSQLIFVCGDMAEHET